MMSTDTGASCIKAVSEITKVAGTSDNRKVNTVAPLSMGHMFQYPQWMPETADSTKPYIYYVFPLHTYLG